MGQDGAVERTPQVRIGDADRRHTDARLRLALDEGRLALDEYDERAAACYAARTRSELDVLTHDLPTDEPVAPTVPATAPPPATRSGYRLPERIGGGVLVAALAGTALFQVGRIVTADDGAAVFGSRDVTVAADAGEVEVGALFGKVRVIVPDGVRVRTDGLVLFGSVECADACDPTAAGRELLVQTRSAFGSVEIATAGERAEEAREDARDDADDD